MECSHWDLFDRVSTMDGIFIPYDSVGNGTKDAYAIRVGDTINQFGAVPRYLLRDFYAECVGEISIADLAARGEN